MKTLQKITLVTICVTCLFSRFSIASPLLQYMRIQFNDKTVSYNSVDSIKVQFTNLTSNESFVKNMEKDRDGFFVNITDLKSLHWEAAISVYTKLNKEEVGRQYYLKKVVENSLTDEIIEAPTLFYNDNWMPRILLNSTQYHVTIIVAEKPEDPFLEIRTSKIDEWNAGFISRTAFIHWYSTPIGEGSWSMPKGLLSGFKQLMVDTTSFLAFSTHMQSLVGWEDVSVYAVLANNKTGKQVIFSYDYSKRS